MKKFSRPTTTNPYKWSTSLSFEVKWHCCSWINKQCLFFFFTFNYTSSHHKWIIDKTFISNQVSFYISFDIIIYILSKQRDKKQLQKDAFIPLCMYSKQKLLLRLIWSVNISHSFSISLTLFYFIFIYRFHYNFNNAYFVLYSYSYTHKLTCPYNIE